MYFIVPVPQIPGPATICVPDEAGRATLHDAFSIRFSQITCFPCPSDGGWSSSNQRTAGGQQSNLTSCLLHQIFSNHLLSLSIRRRLEQQQSAHCRRPAEQLDIMPFASDFFKSLAFLVHQTAAGAAAISALQEASRATWHHAFCIRFFQITCFPCPADGGWSSSNQRTAGGQQSNLTSCLLHQIFSSHLLSLSIRRPLEQQQSAHCRRPAEQLDIMPFASDFFKSLAFLVHQTADGAAAISALQEASRATWHHAFCIRFFQITCFPCPSDGGWSSSNQRTAGGQQSNLTSCLLHQIFSSHLLSLSIRRRLEQQQSAHCRRPAEQLDIMPFASDFFKSLAFLVHQTAAGAAAISALQEASRATWHHAFCIRFFQIIPCPSDGGWSSSNQRTAGGQQSNLTSCLLHQIFSITCFPCPSDGRWSSSNQRTAGGQQSNLTSCLLHQIFSNHLLSLGPKSVAFRVFQVVCILYLAEYLDIYTTLCVRWSSCVSGHSSRSTQKASQFAYLGSREHFSSPSSWI